MTFISKHSKNMIKKKVISICSEQIQYYDNIIIAAFLSKKTPFVIFT